MYPERGTFEILAIKIISPRRFGKQYDIYAKLRIVTVHA
jgi:hypothetical protein